MRKGPAKDIAFIVVAEFPDSYDGPEVRFCANVMEARDEFHRFVQHECNVWMARVITMSNATTRRVEESVDQ